MDQTFEQYRSLFSDCQWTDAPLPISKVVHQIDQYVNELAEWSKMGSPLEDYSRQDIVCEFEDSVEAIVMAGIEAEWRLAKILLGPEDSRMNDEDARRLLIKFFQKAFRTLAKLNNTFMLNQNTRKFLREKAFCIADTVHCYEIYVKNQKL